MKKMKMKLLCIPLMLIALSTTGTTPPADKNSAIVSAEWLENNMDNADLVILDVRDSAIYAAGHIPGSVNVPAYPNGYINAPGEKLPWMELPEKENLFATIGQAGINTNSTVVVIARTSSPPGGMQGAYGLTQASRSAITLIYAGVENVKMLNGGYDKWADEGRTVSIEPAKLPATTYNGKANETIFISKAYVEERIGKTTIIDTRSADVYFGIKPDMSSQRAGHIPTSKCLPAPWFWKTTKTKSGETTYLTWKSTDEIREIAFTVLGKDLSVEIIDYCGVGGYASPVWFVLTQVAGFTDVKFYDGSMQEWTTDPEAPTTKYQYE